ncbi:hypothetical protein EHRUM4_01300, partial [Ehrlichia ruminantium]
HSLQASFVVNLMEPFSEFLQQGSNFSLNLHPLTEDCHHNDVDCVSANLVSVTNTTSQNSESTSVSS